MSSTKLKRMPSPVVEDPAGLDKVLLSAARIAIGYVEGITARNGMPMDLWNGPNGIGTVLQQSFRERGVPNKRLAELVSARTVAEKAGLIKKPKQARRIK